MKKATKEDKHSLKETSKPVISLTPVTGFLAAIIIFFLAQIVAVNILGIIGLLLFGIEEGQLAAWLSSSILMRFITLSLVATTVGLFVWWFLKITRTSWRKIGFNKIRLNYLGQAVIGYGWYLLLFIPTMAVVNVLLPVVDVNQQQQLGFDRDIMGLSLILTGISLVVIPALYEELLMRGVMYTGLRKKLAFIPTLLIVSAVFGLAHIEYGSAGPLHWAAVIDTFLLSVVLVYLREKSESIWPAVFLHGVKNSVAFMLVFVLKVTAV